MPSRFQPLLSTTLAVLLLSITVKVAGQVTYGSDDQVSVLPGGVSNLEVQTAVEGKVYTWTPTATDSNWHNPRNWQDASKSAGVPTGLDDVIIPKGLALKVTTEAFCKNLIFQSGICRLTATAGLSINGKLSIGSPISSSTSVSLAGNINCDSLLIETISGNNTLTVDGTLAVLTRLRIAKANYASTASATLTNTLNVNGTISVGDSVVSEGDRAYRRTLIQFGANGSLSMGGNYATLTAYAETIMSNGGTLSIGGEWRHGQDANFSFGTGTVVYNRNGGQVVRPQTYNNLTLAGSGTKTTTGVIVSKKLSMQGTAAVSTLPIFLTNALLEYKGSSPQVTGAELPASFSNEVIVDNIHGITLNEKKNIRALSLVNGVVRTNGFPLIIGFDNKAGFVRLGPPTAYVEGGLSRVFTVDGTFTFPIGKNGKYRPITIRFTRKPGVSDVAVVTAEQFESPLPAAPPSNTALYTDRHWTLTQSGLDTGTFSYDLSLNRAGFSFSGKPLVLHYDGKAVTPLVAEVSDTAFTAKALGSFSSFALGEESTAASVSADSPAAIVYGSANCTLTATVTRAGGTTPVNSGRVEFFVDNIPAGVSETVSNGTASVIYNPASLAVGSHIIKAVYNGDGTIAGSSSDPAANGVLVIKKATAAITLENEEQVYDGSVKTINVKKVPDDLQGITLKYYRRVGDSRLEVLPENIINAGSYDIEAVLDNANYELPGGATKITGVLIIRKATAKLAFEATTMNPVYTGGALEAGTTATWNGAAVGTVTVSYTKDEVAVTAPVEAGTYRATATLVNENMEATPVSADFVISKAPTTTTVTVSDGIYTGKPKGGVARVTGASGLDEEVIITYTGITTGGILYNNTTPPTEAGSYTATAIYNESDNYLGSEDRKSFSIAQAPAVIGMSGLERIYNGQQQSAVITTDPEGLAVLLTYNGSEMLPANAGSYAVTATLINTNYSAVPATGTMKIDPAEQTISFAALSQKTYGDDPFAVSATASSGLPVHFSVVSGPAVVNDNILTITGAGPVTLRALQAGNDNYKPAAPVEQVFTVNKALATITLGELMYTYNAQPKTATVVTKPAGLSGVIVTYTQGDNPVVAPIAAGSYEVIAVLADENYEAAPVTGELVIEKKTLTIKVNDKVRLYGTANPILDGVVDGLVSTDGISVDYHTDAMETSDAAIYSILASISDPSNKLSNYHVVNTPGTLTITPAPASIVLSDLNPVYDGRAKYASVAVSQEGAGISVKYFQGGNEVYAPVNAGAYAIEAVLTNTNYKLVDEQGSELVKKTGELKIDKASQTITISTPVQGEATFNAGFTVDAVASSGLPVRYSSTLPLINTGNVFTMTSGTGTGLIRVTQGGNENFNPAPELTFEVKAKKVVLGIQVTNSEFLYDGQPKSCGVEVIGSSGLGEKPSIVLVYEGTTNEGNMYNSINPPSDPGTYMVTASVDGNDNFEVAPNEIPFRIYAVPVVSLIPSNPLAINNNSVISAKKGFDVFDMEWHFSCLPEITSGGEPNSAGLTISSPIAGVYSVWVTFKDGLGNSYTTYTSEKVYAVFYDPAAGFVTGGGWINSPVESDLLYMKTGGKATFGFVSKYEKGKNVPTGNTEFQFQAGGMNFRSSAYDWLVIAGSRAQYKGTGTINGAGNYGFMLSAVDGNLAGTADPDRFRIRIWDKSQGDLVVYDNQEGADDDAELTTCLGGGSIVIHMPNSGRKTTTAVAAEARSPEAIERALIDLTVFPNPAVSSFSVQVKSANRSDRISIRVLDLYGRVVETIPNTATGQTYHIGEAYRPGIYFVEVIQGSERRQVKVLKVTE